MMKKIKIMSVLLLTISILTSCSEINESRIKMKSNELIESEFTKNLKVPESYESISTTIVSKGSGGNTINAANEWTIEHSFKAMNSFGMIIPGKLTLKYQPNSVPPKFTISNIESFTN